MSDIHPRYKTPRKGAEGYGNIISSKEDPNLTAPTTPEAKLWNGYGTALKPAFEPIILAMKPNDGTFANNALKHGVAGLNIDGGRIGTTDKYSYKKCGGSSFSVGKGKDGTREYPAEIHTKGRFPANVILDEEASVQLGEPSRFFYCAKSSKAERNAGLEEFEKKIDCDRNPELDSADVPMNRSNNPKKNNHPTVKPIRLMQYLVRLVTKKGGICLDPFFGSGTTGIACIKEGMNYIGIERESDYIKIANARLKLLRTQTNESRI